MNELWIPASASAFPASAETVSRNLSQRAGLLAQRLAAVVERIGGGDPATVRAAGFLADWARSVAADVPLEAAGGFPLDRVVSRLDLTPAETDLVLLTGLAEEHEGLAQTLRGLHPAGEPRPTAGLAVHVLGDQVDRPGLHRLLHEGAVVRAGVVRVDGSQPFFERSLVLADDLWVALQGHFRLPMPLQEVVVPEAPPGLGSWITTIPAARAVRSLRSPLRQVVLVACEDEAVGLSRCARLAADAGVRLVAARVSVDDHVRLAVLGLHALARGAVPVLLLPADLGRPQPVEVPAEMLSGPLLVCAPAGAVRPGPGVPVSSVPTGPVDAVDRRHAWAAAFPHLPEEIPGLAARYPLDPALTAQVAEDLRLQERLDGDLGAGTSAASVPTVIRSRAAVMLPPGVTSLSPSEGWDRIVLGAPARAELAQVVDRLQAQATVLDDWGLERAARANRGVRLLFTGPPGTGKSLAAEVVATALGTDLMVLDVSHVVSKWLGETSKNLAAVFDVAERTQAVLLLDEADALFASRTEVTDAHDRYANLDSAYLLHRMDTFAGLVVLTTNLRQNIDAAFIRRMDHVIEFDLPGQEQRQHLWAQHLHECVRGEDVDLAGLSLRYPVSGAMIRNAAIAAAFLAAADGGRVRRQHLVDSVRREYTKAGKPFPSDPARAATADLRAIRALERATGKPAMEDTT